MWLKQNSAKLSYHNNAYFAYWYSKRGSRRIYNTDSWMTLKFVLIDKCIIKWWKWTKPLMVKLWWHTRYIKSKVFHDHIVSLGIETRSDIEEAWKSSQQLLRCVQWTRRQRREGNSKLERISQSSGDQQRNCFVIRLLSSKTTDNRCIRVYNSTQRWVETSYLKEYQVGKSDESFTTRLHY